MCKIVPHNSDGCPMYLYHVKGLITAGADIEYVDFACFAVSNCYFGFRFAFLQQARRVSLQAASRQGFGMVGLMYSAYMKTKKS